MIMRLWDSEMDGIYNYKAWGKGNAFDSTRAVDILGIEYIGHENEKSLMDNIAESLIATGCIEDIKRTTAKAA